MPQDKFKKEISNAISKAIGKKIDIDSIEIPPNPEMGDYAYPCFNLSKEMKKNPNEIAKEIGEKIKSGKYIGSVRVLGPYINFFVKKETLNENVLSEIVKNKLNYGRGKIKKTTLLEGWQPNTHKAFHIGHIRNAVLGESIARILEFYGHKVIRVSYMGDVGAHVAKWIWYFNKFYKGSIPKKNVSKWAGEIYTEATKKSDGDEKYKEEINEVHKKLEEGDKKLVELWKKTRTLCLDDLYEIFDELGCKINKGFFESEVEKPGKKIVEGLVKNKLAEIDEDAIIMHLEEYNLGVFVLLKSNGASLYSTKDIALAYLKSKKYKFDNSLYIVASEQDFYFKQLFKCLELIKYKEFKKLNHVSYGLVKLKEGKMSSREGNIILYEEFRDDLIKKVEEVMKDRKLKNKKKVIGAVSFGAMKFTMLNQDSNREIIFDSEKALSFDGETGPYTQYTYARICSILKKVKVGNKIKFSLLNSDEEKRIIKLLNEYPLVVEKAAMTYKPNLISRNLLDLCQAFNEYYHKYKVLDEDEALRKARVLLIYCVKVVIGSGLGLLGIEAIEEM